MCPFRPGRYSRVRRSSGQAWVVASPPCPLAFRVERSALLCSWRRFLCASTHLRLGSSPPARGRSTVACRSVARASVHPRLGGAAKLKRSVSRSVTGSSPPARGRPWERSGAKADFRVHPRVCGGAAAVGSLPAGLAGPSPRVRGSRGVGRLRDDERGSIPACAGEPARRWRPTGGRRVHPRVRGPDLAGVCHVRPLTRFIPACGAAGSVRGSVDCRLGSSPRARGWQSRFGVSRATERFIPACAGPP